jgi:hypothetical protein
LFVTVCAYSSEFPLVFANPALGQPFYHRLNSLRRDMKAIFPSSPVNANAEVR